MKKRRTNSFNTSYRWIGVDLDETLALYTGGAGGLTVIGDPIPKMVERVKKWIDEGNEVKIMTARVSQYTCDVAGENRMDVINAIRRWTKKYIGKELDVTSEKDHGMIELWDDRCVQVIPNKGERMYEN